MKTFLTIICVAVLLFNGLRIWYNYTYLTEFKERMLPTPYWVFQLENKKEEINLLNTKYVSYIVLSILGILIIKCYLN